MRCFVAISLPDEVRKEVVCAQGQLRKLDLHAKWVETENLHVTLKFLGEVDEGCIANIKEILSKITSLTGSFDLILSDVGGFPSLCKPRVLWMGINPDEIPVKIIEFLGNRLEGLGFPKEERKPHPHITLARIKSPKNIHKIKQTVASLNLNKIEWQVSKVCLFKSILTSRGPTYGEVFSQSLV